jgi:aspartyl-tRNA(Asn)/glutamyl-tRNA(Gln) amidotransferase subunit B
MRSKETSDDYRYFPEPDLPPLKVDPAWLDELRAALPELPAARRARYVDAFGLSAYDAGVLVADRDAATLFEAAIEADASLATKSVANWVTGEYLRLRNAALAEAPVDVVPTELAGLVRLVDEGAISRANAKEAFAAHATTGAPVAAIVAERGYRQISDTGVVGSAVDEVLAANPNAVADYKAGKTQAIGFIVGQVMKATRGQADAGVVQALVRERLDG